MARDRKEDGAKPFFLPLPKVVSVQFLICLVELELQPVFGALLKNRPLVEGEK